MMYKKPPLNEEFHNKSPVETKSLILIIAFVCVFAFGGIIIVNKLNIKSPKQRENDEKSRMEAEENAKFYTVSGIKPRLGAFAVIYNGNIYYKCPGIIFEGEELVGDYIGKTSDETIPFISEELEELKVKDFMRYNCSEGLELYKYKGTLDALVSKNGYSKSILLNQSLYERFINKTFIQILSEENILSMRIITEDANKTLESDKIKSICSSRPVLYYKIVRHNGKSGEIRAEIVPGVYLSRMIIYDVSCNVNAIIENTGYTYGKIYDYPFEADMRCYLFYDDDITELLI